MMDKSIKVVTTGRCECFWREGIFGPSSVNVLFNCTRQCNLCERCSLPSTPIQYTEHFQAFMICRENYKLRQLETTLKLLLIILVGRRNHLPTFLTFKFPAFSLQALLIWPSLHLNSFFHSATLFSTMFSTYNASKECLSFHLSKNYINMQFKYIFHHLFLLVFLPR